MAKYVYNKYYTVWGFIWADIPESRWSEKVGSLKPGDKLYSGYRLDPALGAVGTGSSYLLTSDEGPKNGWYYIPTPSNALFVIKTKVATWENYIKVWGGAQAFISPQASRNWIRGSYIGQVVAEDGEYPQDGMSGSYWYVRKGLANASPTLSLDTTDNRTLYENDTITISGNAKDINSGDVVTVRYSINGASSRAITTAISDTSNIPFSKSLVFKNGKLFDGATEVTSDLAEGSQHILRVWATDDKGGTSTEQIRDFYVVPNRPAKLTIKPFSPASDLIETDKVTIQGNAVDPDGNNITVAYKVANGSYQEIYSGTGGDFDFLVNLSDLVVGKNTISVQVKDTYGATSTKTLEITKSKDVNELKTAVARYKLSPPNGSAKGIVLWIEREVGDLTIDVNIHMGMNGEAENFVPMTLNSTAFVTDDIEEDEFIFEADAEKENIVLEITMNRSSTATNKGITLISGVLS